MDISTLIAQRSGELPPGFVPPARLQTGLAECAHKRCRNKVAIKRDGTPAHACQPCLDRRARSCARRRKILVAQGGCRRCAYRKRLEGRLPLPALPRRTRPGNASRSARMPSTPRPSTSSRPSPSASTRPATWISGSRPGTDDRSRRHRPHTGRRCRTPNHAKSANGQAPVRRRPPLPPLLAVPSRSRRAIHGSRVSASSGALSSPTRTPRAVGGDRYRRRGEPLTGRDAPHAGGRDGQYALRSTSGFLCGCFRHRFAVSRAIPSMYITLGHTLADRGDQWVSDIPDSGLTHQGAHEVAVQAATG